MDNLSFQGAVAIHQSFAEYSQHHAAAALATDGRQCNGLAKRSIDAV